MPFAIAFTPRPSAIRTSPRPGRQPGRRDRQRADRAVQPEARVEPRHTGAHEQHDAGVRGREQQQPGGVGKGGICDLLLVRQVVGPVGVADRPRRDAASDEHPCCPLSTRGDAARHAHQAAGRQHECVEPVVHDLVRAAAAESEDGVAHVYQQRGKRREEQQAYRPRHGAVEAGKHRSLTWRDDRPGARAA
jgi:hypothetical protein